MKACGLVVEYNPFHNGHAYHASESKRQTDADVLVAVMSGPFLQRGEPALTSKWSRAEMALRGGIDLVIELPYAFATQKAENFAKGAISLLEAVGCDTFCFGSEDGRIEPFLSARRLLMDHQASYDKALKGAMESGLSYPASASLAFREISQGKETLDLTAPNNILGKEYVSTALENGYAIQPFTIKRIAAGYHDTELTSQSIASATGIRKAILEEQRSPDYISAYVPETTLAGLNHYLSANRSLHDWEMYWSLLKYRILSSSPGELSSIYEIEEGIEYRFKEMARKASSFKDFMTAMKTKRYTWTRLQRMCVHILTRTGKEEMLKTQFPSYIRLLGMTGQGREYLGSKKKKLALPLISKPSSYKEKDITIDRRASDIYAMGLNEPYSAILMKREYGAPIILH